MGDIKFEGSDVQWEAENKRSRIDSALMEDFRVAINKHSQENNSNTPDYILARMLLCTLRTFERIVIEREIITGIKQPSQS